MQALTAVLTALSTSFAKPFAARSAIVLPLDCDELLDRLGRLIDRVVPRLRWVYLVAVALLQRLAALQRAVERFVDRCKCLAVPYDVRRSVRFGALVDRLDLVMCRQSSRSAS